MRRVLAILTLSALAACRAASPSEVSESEPTVAAAPAPPDPEEDEAFESCSARIAELESVPAAPGSPELERQRHEIFGRARGEPVVFVREPALAETSSADDRHFARVRALKRLPAPELRARVLRDGYLFSTDPHEALALVTLLELPDLFDEPVIFLQRGSETHELLRVDDKQDRYVYAQGGGRADLLLYDRIAVERAALSVPLHRDLRGLARQTGFDRARLLHLTEAGVLAELRFGGVWVRAVLEAEGARLSLGCLDATATKRRQIETWQAADAVRRRALAGLRAAIDQQLSEALPFDRPRLEETAERDGQLRPAWRWAYKNGQSWFSFEEESYPVYDSFGRPHPPQVCVDFVLDSFERASGTWFSPAGTGANRSAGGVDFDAYGITNRRAVLAFEKFAEESPALFEHLRLEPEQRIKFQDRARYFGFLRDQADLFRPGDVVAIQGLKNDGLIHQHAILIEDTDPLTGFPDALADQMKRPRRRTWEGIMAEAPLRSLLYRVRPKPDLFAKVARSE